MSEQLALFYGFIQGVAEFLPVSSSGHLALLPFFGHFEDPGVFFDLSLHLGTAIAIAVYFYKEIIRVFFGIYKILLRMPSDHDTAFSLNCVFATTATFVLVMILKKFAFDYGRSAYFIAFNLSFFGILMYLADRFGASKIGVELYQSKQIKYSLLIGAAQALAIFPGVSRSGITITTARAFGVERAYAGRFSFLLCLPVVFGGFILELPHALHSGAPIDWHAVIVGSVSSFAFGIITIHFFLKLLRSVGLIYFTAYRIILSGLIIYLLINN